MEKKNSIASSQIQFASAISLSIALAMLLSLEQPLVHPQLCRILENIDVDVDELNGDKHYAPTPILSNITKFFFQYQRWILSMKTECTTNISIDS